MEFILNAFSELASFLSTTSFSIGTISLSLLGLFLSIVALGLLIFLSRYIQLWTTTIILRSSSLDLNTRQAVGTFARYAVIVTGLLIILETAGIDLTSLTVIIGALSVGVGLGLQGITGNFVSGLIILLERPIKVGDRVEVGSIIGDVTNISARATTITTNDNISIIVPNSEFISTRVINWSLTDRKVRLQIPVGVSYSSNPEEVEKLLLEVANEQDGLLFDPKPDVVFLEFGESSLNFTLRVWTSEYINKPFVLKSLLNFAIAKKFREHDIVIPFPQRDLHIKSDSTAAAPRTKRKKRPR